MVKSEYAAEVRLLKNAVRDFEKAIRAAKQAFEAEDYYYMPEAKRREEGRIQGLIDAKIYFEKYYKRFLHEQEEAVVANSD